MSLQEMDLVLPPIPNSPSVTVALAAVSLILLYLLFVYVRSPLSRLPALHWSSHFARYNLLWVTRYHSRKHVLYDAHIGARNDGKMQPLIRVSPNEVSMLSMKGLQTVYVEGWDRSEHYASFSNLEYAHQQQTTSIH